MLPFITGDCLIEVTACAGLTVIPCFKGNTPTYWVYRPKQENPCGSVM
jgi:hypothetical protein